MKKEARPRIKIELTTIDYVLEAFGGIILAVLLAITAYFYPQLPEQIPSHYNFYAQPDAYSGKSIVWLLPLFGLVLYALLTIGSRYPHTFNYPVLITRDNAYRTYKIGIRSIRVIKVAIVVLFSFLNLRTIQIGLQMKLDPTVVLLNLLVLFVLAFALVMLYRLIRKSK